ncbi:MAG: PDZ domain-containing protein [Steroidobacteraceae bacterium]
MHISPRSTVLTLCLSLLATVAFADNGPMAPAAPPAPSSPPDQAAPAAVPNPPSVDGSALQARMDAAQTRLDAAQRREEIAQQREQAAQQRQEAMLQARLDAARQRMEVAAQQLAALSAQMYGPMMQRSILAGSLHALIGVQLERASGAAGVRVREVSPGGPAERAGVRRGDLIIAVNGTNVRGRQPARRVIELLRGVKPGDKVGLSVMRDGKTRDLTMTARPDWYGVFLARQLPDIPVPPVPPLPPVKALAAWGGAPMIIRGPVAEMELARLTPELGRYFGTDAGVLVVRAPPDGALGLKDGDVILSIGGRKPIDSSHVIRILASYDPGEKVSMEVMRAHRRILVAATLPAASAMNSRVLIMRGSAMLGRGPVVSLRRADGAID